MAVILGTAGHIDHGKTSLVRALTGIDCDRLEEEKRRGITIELGFAWLDLPDGSRLGIVDVPGHERFVRNMVAGAAGVDFVMLVIAADEGVMPQSREHLEICSLLGIRNGFVALTKTDMVDAELLELAREDVAGFLKGSFLEGAPIFPVSSTTGEGLEAIRAHILATAAALPPRSGSDIFRLPVDRVFTMKGHGTVVTGTVVSGSLDKGEELCLVPGGARGDVRTRARSLQQHGQASEKAVSGQRCAINLQGLAVEDVERGQILARPGRLFAGKRWLARMTCLPSAPNPLRHRGELHFHHGSRECLAKVFLRDRDKLAPGETAVVEIRFSGEMAGIAGDHCVLRSGVPLRTVAGGIILDPLPPLLTRRDPAHAEKLEIQNRLPDLRSALQGSGKAADRENLVLALVRLSGRGGTDEARLAVRSGLPDTAMADALGKLASRGAVLIFDREARQWIGKSAFEALVAESAERAKTLHAKDPLKPLFSRNAFAAGWGRNLSPKLVHKVIEQAVKNGILASEGDGLRLASHSVTLGKDDSDLRRKLLDAHIAAGLSPKNLGELLTDLGSSKQKAAPVLKVLCDEGELVKINEGLYYHKAVHADFLARVNEWFASNDDLDLAGLRQILPLSRKYLIALLEYLDNERITVRVGDARKLRRQA